MKMFVSSIRIDGGTQARVALNDDAVAEYAEAIVAGATLPPIVVFFDGVDYWLADGFTRYHAHNRAKQKNIAVDVRNGTKRDALLYAVGANAEHGQRRTNADKRKAVGIMLDDAEWTRLADREIARQCNVSNNFVSALRHEREKAAKARVSSDDSTGSSEEKGDGETVDPESETSEKPLTAAERRKQENAKAATHKKEVEADAEELKRIAHEANERNRRLLEDMEALAQEDTKAELLKARELNRDYESRISVLTKQTNEMDKSLQIYVRDFKELRKVTGTDSNRNAMVVIRAAFKVAA